MRMRDFLMVRGALERSLGPRGWLGPVTGMASPSKSLATLRPDLGGTFTEFDLAMSRQGFIGLRIMPVFEANLQASPFGKVTLESLLRSLPTTRAPGSGYNRDAWEFEDDSYATHEHGFEGVVDDRESQMYKFLLEHELITAERTRDVVIRNMEIRIADKLQDSATYTPTTVTNEWNDLTNATPVDDVEGRIQALWDKGIIANALVISRKVFRALRRADQVIDLLKSDGAGQSVEPGNVTINMLKQVFDLEHILVGNGMENTANAGQDASISSIWSDEYASVMRVAETNDIQEPAWGRTFHWADDGSSIGTAMESYREENVRGDVIRARMDTDEKVLYEEAHELLDNITDPAL